MGMGVVYTANVALTATMPMLQHADNIDWADKMDEWKAQPENRELSKAGDDRTPSWRWIGCLNFDESDGVVTVPAEYIMSCIMGGAAKVPTGKKQGTYKSISQSGLICDKSHWPLLVKGKPIRMKDVNALKDLKTFKEHLVAVERLGFSLFVKRARVGSKKHIRVRPRFDDWSTSGDIMVTDEQIELSVLQNILSISGRLKGLGDWRPGGPTPGQFGTFKAIVTKS